MQIPSSLLALLDETFLSEIPALGLPRLGPAFKDLTGNQLHEALVSHRILNKYEVPDESAAKLRKTVSIMEMLHYDAQGVTSFDYRMLQPEVRHDFLCAKQWLAALFKGFRRLYTLRFPSNETFVSAKGLTDLYFKLAQADQWLVSPDNVDDCVEILLRNRALLNVVKHRFRKTRGEKGKAVLAMLRAEYLELNPSKADIRRMMVKFMFRATTRLHRTARVTAISKNNNADRVITLEALWNMVAQLSYASDIRELLNRKLGYDLTTRQDVHRSLIRSGSATIDLKSASDSNWLSVLDDLLPERVIRDLRRLRTGVLEYEKNGEIVYQPLNMLAPMGCGFTFEVMTVVLLAHSRVLDKGASVFGDDIIISPSVASRFVRNIEAMGWVVNQQKSYLNGNFRESCGGFCDLQNQKLLVSYDIKRPTTMAEFHIVMSKVWIIGHALQAGPLRSILAKMYAKVLMLVDRDTLYHAFGPTPIREDVIYVDALWARVITTRATKVTKAISRDLQRTVEVVLPTIERRPTKKLRGPVGPIAYACFLRRGRSYEVPQGRVVKRAVQVDKWSGSPLRDFFVELEA